jgi:hypothetical protein
MKNKLIVFSTIVATIFAISAIPFKPETAIAYHTSDELEFFKHHFRTPIAPGEFFLTPENCKGCHGFDTLGIANVDESGKDVNLYDDWETSMMGLSAMDPLWRAKVSHELLTNPAHANELQTLCTSCHAPAGHYSAFYKGQQYYTLADLAVDSLGLSGVSCTTCHAIGDSSALGAVFTGNIPYDTTKKLYGPFPFPVAGPMQLYVGMTPVYSTHVSEGRFCSPCHTLISNTVDLNGNATGGTFVEQATYHEWVNSIYPSQAITCQGCHMPQIEDAVILANGNIGLPGRTPFNLHQFAGANSFMVKLMKQNKATLGITASDNNFDSTLFAISDMLKQQTLNINAGVNSVANDTAYVDVLLENKAGHKFPSGYPSRRAVVQIVVTKNNGDTIFASGMFDQSFEVINAVTPYEEHHDVITQASQKQIYEMVMGDVNGDLTTVLERSATHLKDNRIPPVGFTTMHYAYDTCQIAGAAQTDADFNKNGAVEGTGKDIVHYHVPLNGYSGFFNVKVYVYYQTLPPAFLNEMSTFSSPEINSFLMMYNNADKNPVLIARDSVLNVSTGFRHSVANEPILISPNPTSTGIITVSNVKSLLIGIDVFDERGKKIAIHSRKISASVFELTLPAAKGIYYISVQTQTKTETQKVLRI